jgi:hypothetical protein
MICMAMLEANAHAGDAYNSALRLCQAGRTAVCWLHAVGACSLLNDGLELRVWHASCMPLWFVLSLPHASTKVIPLSCHLWLISLTCTSPHALNTCILRRQVRTQLQALMGLVRAVLLPLHRCATHKRWPQRRWMRSADSS